MTFVNFNHRYNRTTFYIPINTTHVRLFSIPNRLNSNQTNFLLNFFSSSSSLTTDHSSIASLTRPNGHRIYSKNFLANAASTCKNHSKKCKRLKRECLQKQTIPSRLSILYAFQPLKIPMIYVLNRFTSCSDMVSCMHQIEKAVTFSMYAQRDRQTNQVNYIAIEVQKVEQQNCSVLIIDFLNMPDPTTSSFAIIKFLLLSIFKDENKCFLWNDSQRHDLYALVDHQYLPRIILESIQIIQLESLFKKWYNKTYSHQRNCSVLNYYSMEDEWTVLKALAYTFHEVIYTSDEKLVKISKSIQVLVHCCLSITKLSLVITLDWTQEQLSQFEKYHRY
ncbi:unnamed protein product [Rotaria magnacalcarata]|uniref:Uncharacterized protein n=1 Tax=Rotaria magnacalcarata TaxID=392030 RepID=A0A816VY31_9BILA|nr:unnamed protein product [Rotaria magnacalcarata]CAF2130522.1 unnamed protein product [Rotaria magnacalcarata]CAF3774983.1 unnamed protein product [Rotaria magnacalcarata]CAF3799905.1 unnamed protein product [Rotaria magnacalcarata]CAF3814468.1 unnamed protein product [Rotaria magnacalcarata]